LAGVPGGSHEGRVARWLVGALLAVGLMFLAGCGQRPPSLPRLGPHAVVLAFGDSLTYGTGARADQSYPAILSRLIGREVINSGKPGEGSAQGLKRLRAALGRQAPALLLLCHGGNDLLRRRPSKETEANLRLMVAVARERAVPVVLVGVPQPGVFLSPADLYPRIAQDLALPYEGEVLADVLSDPRLKSDRVHPNAEGYRRIAEAIAALLRDAGAI
jgi:acyl-CoA thioesterase-1